MKKLITIFCSLFSLITCAQVFNGTGGAIQNNGNDTYFSQNVSGLSHSSLDSTFGVQQVCVNIAHSDVTELNIYLLSPSGTKVQLALCTSSSGSNYTNTCFDNSGGSSITLGTAPYAGTFRPVGYLGRFNTGQAANGSWNLIVKDWNANTNAGTLLSWSLTFGTSPAHPVVFTSSNLPIVIINTTQPITDTKTLVSMGIIDNGPARNNITDPKNAYNAKAQIHFRGSSTKDFEKKSYSIETADMAGNKLIGPLLGMPPESDWDLIATYQDKSLVRDPLTYDLFGAMGHYSPRYKNVEVVLNNEYQGIYELTEKPKRDSNRIHVNTMTPADNVFPNVTGGYVFKIDRATAPGWYSLFPGNFASTHFFYNYEYPNPSEISVAQQNYLKSYVDSFETVMNSANYADTTTGYKKYMHMGSFIDFFIINELSKNADAYRLSTYMYKDRITHGGKLHIGPVWDYNIAWHNCNYGNSSNAVGWQYQIPAPDPTPTWWDKFMQDPNFVNALYCRYSQLRQNVLSISNINSLIDATVNEVTEAQQRNFIQWPVLGAYIYPNPQNQTTANFLSEVNDVKTWVSSRIAWLDGAIVGTCVNIGITENNFNPFLKVYPNPMESSTVFSMHLREEADISLCVVDVVGNEVNRLLKSHTPPGEFKIQFEKKHLPAGVYFYQLQINDEVKKGKIIIQ